jgi:hypothetical protein
MNGEVVGKQDAAKEAEVDETDEPPQTEPTTDDGALLRNKTKVQLCVYAKEKFGEAASNLNAEMPKPAIIEEIERLEFESEV